MNLSLLFLSGLAVTAIVAFSVVAYLQRPLRKLLGGLCGNDDRAQFWTVFSNLTVAFVPSVAALAISMLAAGHLPSANRNWDATRMGIGRPGLIGIDTRQDIDEVHTTPCDCCHHKTTSAT
jgi:hypothetical protein